MVFEPGKNARSILRVLTYHRVADLDARSFLDPKLISATPADFARQMRHLAKHYHVISMEEALQAVQDGRVLPRNAVLITFDDAYNDFKDHAWPVLKQLQLPVTVFVPTFYPDQNQRAFWWDRLYASINFTPQVSLENSPVGRLPLGTSAERDQTLRRLQSHLKTMPHFKAMQAIEEICTELLSSQSEPRKTVLSWEELHQLAQEGVTLAPHTRTHPILTQLPLAQARDEIAGSYQDLKKQIGEVLPVFAYPNGSHNDGIVKLLQEAGFRLAFNGPGPYNEIGSVDRLRLRRINITRRTSSRVFRIRLLKGFSYIEKWRHRKRLRQEQAGVPD